MRQSNAALAWIDSRTGSQSHSFVLWNSRWGRYSLVGGHLAEGESFRDCVLREVEEELQIRRDVDFCASHQAVATLEYVGLSEWAREMTRYCHEIFVVTFNDDVLRRLDGLASGRWITCAEIASGITSAGQPIAEQVTRVWNRLQHREAQS